VGNKGEPTNTAQIAHRNKQQSDIEQKPDADAILNESVYPQLLKPRVSHQYIP